MSPQWGMISWSAPKSALWVKHYVMKKPHRRSWKVSLMFVLSFSTIDGNDNVVIATMKQQGTLLQSTMAVSSNKGEGGNSVCSSTSCTREYYCTRCCKWCNRGWCACRISKFWSFQRHSESLHYKDPKRSWSMQVRYVWFRVLFVLAKRFRICSESCFYLRRYCCSRFVVF
jgi:hypothetical protein